MAATLSASAITTRSRWVTFAVCAGAAYVTTLDLSIVNVAFPEILREFDGASRADLSWIVTVYNIFFASLLVVAGKLADQIGRKRVFLAGVTVFGAGSAVCTLAPSLGVLIVGRAIQGAGGAFMTPASLGLLLAAFPLERRTQTVAMWGGIGALGVASGPSLGALLISATDWRAAFWINLPVCVALFVVGTAVLVETPRVPARRPDLLGASMVTGALACLALGLSQSDSWGWTDVRTLGSLALGAVLAAGFVARQRVHPEPVLDLALFESRSFSIANLAGAAFFAGFAALGLNNVLFLRGVWGYSVLHAGLLSAIAPLTVAVLAPLSGKLASALRVPPVRRSRTGARRHRHVLLSQVPHDHTRAARARGIRRDRGTGDRLLHSGQRRRRRVRTAADSTLDRWRRQQHRPPGRVGARGLAAGGCDRRLDRPDDHARGSPSRLAPDRRDVVAGGGDQHRPGAAS